MIQRVLIIHCAASPADDDLTWLLSGCRHARMEFDVLHADTYPWPELSGYSCVVLALDSDFRLVSGKSKRIRRHVHNGAGLVVAKPYWDATLAATMGVDAHPPKPVRDDQGLVFTEDFVPGATGLVLSGTDIRLNTGTRQGRRDGRTFLETVDGTPVAWCSDAGRGRCVTFNTKLLTTPASSGLLVEAILRTQDVSLRPVANAGVIQVDDFPAAVSPISLEPVWSRYRLDVPDFYDRIWLPDVLALAERHGIPYTFAVTFNFNDRTQRPFGFEEWTAHTLTGEDEPYAIRTARRIARRHELGLHGYNHVPFIRARWPDEQLMREAIRSALERWSTDDLGPLPRTYVAPMNIYDEAAVRVLAEECPSLSSVCNYYDDRLEDGQFRDFGPEPWQSRLTSLPRNTSGYVPYPDELASMLSRLSSAGVWSHFIHPDDIFDTPENRSAVGRHRNGEMRSWRTRPGEHHAGLFNNFAQWIERIEKHYPWLRYLRTEDAVPVIRDHMRSNPVMSRHGDCIRVTNGGSDFYELVVRGENAPPPSIPPGVELVSDVRTGGVSRFVLRSNLASFELRVAR